MIHRNNVGTEDGEMGKPVTKSLCLSVGYSRNRKNVGTGDG